jgi:hypothetical protein
VQKLFVTAVYERRPPFSSRRLSPAVIERCDKFFIPYVLSLQYKTGLMHPDLQQKPCPAHQQQSQDPSDHKTDQIGSVCPKKPQASRPAA